MLRSTRFDPGASSGRNSERGRSPYASSSSSDEDADVSSPQRLPYKDGTGSSSDAAHRGFIQVPTSTTSHPRSVSDPAEEKTDEDPPWPTDSGIRRSTTCANTESTVPTPDMHPCLQNVRREAEDRENDVSASLESIELNGSDSEEDREELRNEWQVIENHDMIPEDLVQVNRQRRRRDPPTPTSSANRPSFSRRPPVVIRGPPTITFDDEDAVLIDSDDSMFDWAPRHHGFETEFPPDTMHETYPFERDYPNAAPILRYLFNLPPAQITAIIARTLRGQSVISFDAFAEHLEDAVRNGRVVMDEAIVSAHNLAAGIEGRVTEWGTVMYTTVSGIIREINYPS